MLNSVKSSLAIAVVSVLLSGFAYADVNADLQNICTIVKADDKDELRKKMKKVESDHSLKLQDYYSGITCGGESLIRTAMLNNAVEAGTMMIKKMPKSQLTAPEADGKTLVDWTNEKGFSSSAIAAELNARI
ncbi:DUF3718 domain-containing protein [Paraglaciecola hydrolytica]|uniref:DUF3718 domain-containing protein n=1 Tax=Paraglaciecola hydrolytica TaxID=1799789 RepID=A0A136A3D9_9ALTE|nr:DUF3718 domain-containing protein [Paraglaciecola hydrolytica]KXI29640.1 hypothetical protein AX660_06220 [Paraglaciecola hydrolytica]